MGTKRFKTNGVQKPHKLILILAVLDMARTDSEWNGFIELNENLFARFRIYFLLFGCQNDDMNITNPFLHLRSSYFWKLIPVQGTSETDLQKLRTGRISILNKFASGAQITPSAILVFKDIALNLQLTETIVREMMNQKRGQ